MARTCLGTRIFKIDPPSQKLHLVTYFLSHCIGFFFTLSQHHFAKRGKKGDSHTMQLLTEGTDFENLSV